MKIFLAVTTVLTLSFFSFASADHQMFDTGNSLNYFENNQYITGKNLDRIERIVYSMSQENIEILSGNIQTKISEIQNANISQNKKNILIGILNEIDEIVQQVSTIKQTDIDQVLKEITADQ